MFTPAKSISAPCPVPVFPPGSSAQSLPADNPASYGSSTQSNCILSVDAHGKENSGFPVQIQSSLVGTGPVRLGVTLRNQEIQIARGLCKSPVAGPRRQTATPLPSH